MIRDALWMAVEAFVTTGFLAVYLLWMMLTTGSLPV